MTAASFASGRPIRPRGYPTLSKANLEPTKAAVAKYEAIVAAGGFPVMPEVELEPGATDPAVATLRQRLTASGDLAGRLQLSRTTTAATSTRR